MSLDWGLNPVIFFVLLAVSVVLAVWMKKWQVAWLLPAFVLYFGLDWTLSSPWSLLFKLVFWLAVLVVLVTAVMPGKTRFPKTPVAIMGIVVTVALVGSSSTLATAFNDFTGQSDSADSASDLSDDEAEEPVTTTETATATTTVTAEPSVPTAEENAAAIMQALKDKGFKPEDWTPVVDQTQNPADVNTSYSFSKQRLFTNEDVSAFLNGSSNGSEMARKVVTSSLDTDCDRQRALDGSGYVPIQFKIGVQYGGNTYKDGDKIITPDAFQHSGIRSLEFT